MTDDGSADGTPELIESFGATAPFKVRVYRNSERLGYRANFMKAIDYCLGDLIACCDQDDMWDVRKVEHVESAFTDQAVKLVFHGALLIDGEGERLGPANLMSLPERNQPFSFFSMQGVLGFTIAFRRELAVFGEYRFKSVDHLSPSHPMAHDQWLFFLASVLGDIKYLDEPLVDYRQHGRNTYGHKPLTIIDKVKYRLENHGTLYRDFALGAASRAAVLEDMKASGRLTDHQLALTDRAIPYYKELAQRFELRYGIYDGKTLYARTKAFLKLKAAGGYSSDPIWGINQKSAVKDIVLGLLLRPLMIEPSKPKLIS